MQYAALRWDKEHQTPESMDFGDVYYSRGEGIAESRYVFVTGNGLPEALAGRRHFTVTETGFGTGLNLRVLWQSWQAAEAAGQPMPPCLHYISYEQFPLSKADFTRALRGQPVVPELAEALMQAYPPALEGAHHRSLLGGRLQLTLVYGDIADWLPRQEDKVDAWFLDGFAPAKNPGMWQDSLFRQMARLSKPGARFSTFTAAAVVREGLKAAGFEVAKRQGFGHKRHSLWGFMPGEAQSRTPQAHSKEIIIAGAGIAGATAAWHLAEAGWQVTLWEAGAAPALQASANPAALCSPMPEAGFSPRQRFYTSALSYALDFWPRILPDWQPCGWLKLAMNAEEAEWQAKILSRMGWAEDCLRAVDAVEASRIAGQQLTAGGLYSPLAGWVPLAQAVGRILQHPKIHPHYHRALHGLERQGDEWLAIGSDGHRQRFPKLLIATAQGLPGLEGITLHPSAGQLSFVRPNAASEPLPCILNYGGHVTPPVPHIGHVVGATYRRGSEATDLRAVDDAENLSRWRNATHSPLPEESCGSWAAIRWSARNHLPVLMENAPGLWLNLGHGSRGSLSAPYAALQLRRQLEA